MRYAHMYIILSRLPMPYKSLEKIVTSANVSQLLRYILYYHPLNPLTD